MEWNPNMDDAPKTLRKVVMVAHRGYIRPVAEPAYWSASHSKWVLLDASTCADPRMVGEGGEYGAYLWMPLPLPPETDNA